MKYTIPLNKCVNPADQWPGDEQWGSQSFKDSQLNELEFNRTFYKDGDSGCSDEPDFVQKLPLRACIGPFGDPRPWGSFKYGN